MTEKIFNIVDSELIRMIFKREADIVIHDFYLNQQCNKGKEMPLRHECKPIFLSMWYLGDTYFSRDYELYGIMKS